jgi:endonuclease/exonuclease/phosphatase family metal-dependent hydrolase
MRPRITGAACWLAAATALAWAGVRVFGLERWYGVQLIAFTPYAAALSVLPVVLALALRRWVAAVSAALAGIVLVGAVAPRAVRDEPRAGGPTVVVMTANLLGGGADPGEVVRLVRAERVDVLAVQELSPAGLAALDAAGLAGLLPHRVVEPIPSPAGTGLFARHPLIAAGVRVNPGGFRQARATVLVPGAAPLVTESVHPCAPYAASQVGCWRADLAGQPRAGRAGPVRMLAGDFNATLDHAPLRALLRSGYVDAADAAGVGLVGTWGPYDGDRIPPVTIDHVLVDRRVAVRAAAVHPVAGSDHRAVVARLALPAA